MDNTITQTLTKLAEDALNIKTLDCQPLSQGGSRRQYIRLNHDEGTLLGVYNPNPIENQAYIGMTSHFLTQNCPVPKILGVANDGLHYLVEDLGDQTLLKLLLDKRVGDTIPEEVLQYYRQALEQLAVLQITAGANLDDSLCWERKRFDKQSMLWDLNYFKYYFLRIKSPGFNEQRLEDDFHRLADYLLEAQSDYFMFRDFQARNIMIHDGRCWFIDFQGGRRGALPYDVISLLYQAKASLPHSVRESLLEHYLTVASRLTIINEAEFRARYGGFQLIRFLQVLGAYGFRGLIEGKPHFIESIPFALSNLRWWLGHNSLPVDLPELKRAVEGLLE